MNFIGHKIKKIRLHKGFTQAYMADRLGKTQSDYSRLEQADDKINLKILDSIAEVFGMTKEDILKYDEKAQINVNNNNNHIEQGVVYQAGIDMSLLIKQINDKESKIEKLLIENASLKVKLNHNAKELRKIRRGFKS